MLNARIHLQSMAARSIDVLAHPQPRVFHAYGARSSGNDALTYVALAAFLTTLLSMLAFRSGSATGVLWSVLDELFAFYLFTGIIYLIGKQRGGLGSFDEIAYCFALFYAPIQVLSWALFWLVFLTPLRAALLPWLWLMQLASYGVQAYYAHVAVRGVMGFRQREAWTAVVAGLVTLLIVHLAFTQGAAGI